MNVRDMIENFSSTPFSFRGRQKTSSSTIYWQISSVKSCLKIHLFQSSTFHVQYNLHNQPWQMYACALESSATTAVAFCFKSLLLWHIFKINGSEKKTSTHIFIIPPKCTKIKPTIGLTGMDTSHSDQPTQLYFKTNKFSTYSISCYM